MEKNKVKVTIAGVDYALTTEETPEYSAKKAEQSADNLRAQIKDYLEDASQSKSERDFYKREIDRLKTEQKAGAAQINLFSSEKEPDSAK